MIVSVLLKVLRGDSLLRDEALSCPNGVGFIFKSQPIIDRLLELRFPHCGGRYRNGQTLFIVSPGCWVYRFVEGFPIRRWGPSVPGWRWLHFRDLANERSARRAGVSTLCGVVSTRGIVFFNFSVLFFVISGDTEGFLSRGWDIIFPMYAQPRGFSQGATL